MPQQLPSYVIALLVTSAFELAGGSRVQAADRPALANPGGQVPQEWLITAERTDFGETNRYDAAIRYCRRLAAAGDWIEYRSFGTSPEGRELPLVIASKERAFTPEAARATGKLIVFAQSCIHASECAGKDASLMLLRDIAITRRRAGLLDHVILLVNPIFNTDGHERFSPYSRINQNGPAAMGWRVTSRNLNLNRDYLKADAAEMRAWLALWNAWRPDLHFDHHSTDGGDWQYDLMYATAAREALAAPVADWLDEELLPRLLPALESDGHLPMPYFGLLDSKDPARGIHSGGFLAPRYSTGYAAARNRPSLLVETHALKPYRTRVIGHYNIMARTLEILNQRPETLRAALGEADRRTVALGRSYDPQRRVALAATGSEDTVPLSFKGIAYRRELSAVSGSIRIVYAAGEPFECDTVWRRGTRVTRTVVPPLGYIIPPQWSEAIDRVQAHGLRGERLLEPLTAEFESYRFNEVSFPASPYEGRFRPRYSCVPVRERRTYRPGSVIVWLNQPDAAVAVHLFEPEAPDSLVAWGLFNSIFERKEYGEHYVLEGLARRMMTADPALAAEFEARIARDREFAADPTARLYFFYERSPYWDDHRNVYPVGRITRLPGVRTERL